MKTKLITTLLACLTGAMLHGATLNESTDYNAFYLSIRGNFVNFFDEYRTIPYVGPDGQLHDPQGWVSLYGILNGGSLFFTDTHNVSWDFTSTPYTMRWILTYTDTTSTLFRIGSAEFEGAGVLPAGTNIVVFYGTGPESHVPEGDDATFLLLLFGVVSVMTGNTFKKADR